MHGDVMRKFVRATLGIAQGEVALFSDFQDGGSMWTGDGPRERRHSVAFDEPFQDAPIVQLGLVLWDVHHGANLRTHTLAENVRPDGFDIVFRTWGDTRIARAVIGWTAFGTAVHDDDWTL